MINFAADPKVTDALKQWRAREAFPTDLGSAELRGISRQVMRRSVFSARTTSAHYLQEIADVVDGVLSNKTTMAAGRVRLMQKLRELGYDPARGFAGDPAVPPAEQGSLQDLGSERRLNLVIETNVRMAAGYGKDLAGRRSYALREFPAYEIVRLYRRSIERGSPDSHTDGWQRRWQAAAESVNWWGVSRAAFATGRMVAAKLSGVWAALGDGEGGYTDVLGNPYEPFAFGSGMGRKAIARAEWLALSSAKLPPVAYVQPERAARAGDEVVTLRVSEFDAAWKKDPGYYIGRGGKEIAGRREGFEAWRSQNPQAPVEMPEVEIDKAGLPQFTDGRHRFATLRDTGEGLIQVSMSPESARRAREHGLATPAPTLAPTPQQTETAFSKLAPDLRATLEAEWRALGI